MQHTTDEESVKLADLPKELLKFKDSDLYIGTNLNIVPLVCTSFFKLSH